MPWTGEITAETGLRESVLGDTASFAAFSDSSVAAFSDGSGAAYFTATYETGDWDDVDLSGEE